MKLEDLGYNDKYEQIRIENNLEDFDIGRIIAEHKERYIVKSSKGEFDAEITGNLRFTANAREDFPAVGDWVAFIQVDANLAIIHSIMPRSSILSRRAVGKFGEQQLIATNIDFALLVQAVDRDFNINRLERYLTICYSSKVKPLIVLTKTDLIESGKLSEITENIKLRINNIPVIPISNETKYGYETIESFIEKGKTYCMLGSSGVGKSTLMNNLSGEELMKTDSISISTNKGRHITSHRELIVLKNGGILIDNPGMREIGIVDPSDGLETAFDNILRLAKSCKFSDCTHTNEMGCAVIEAMERGELDKKSYENFLKMEKEKAHYDLSVAQKRKKDKDFGKMIKNFKKRLRDID
jgi:ribosome biogenesis GTPase